MRPFHLALCAALLLAACSDSTGPLVFGRWAAPGIELQAAGTTTELRLPCAIVSPLPPLRPGLDGRFSLRGRMTPTMLASPPGWALTLVGQIRGDTIVADLVLRAGVAPPSTTHYVMVRGADPQLIFACVA